MERKSLGTDCESAADAPGDACQQLAACEAKRECDFAASPEAYCKNRLDYYRGRGGGCELVEPPKPIASARTIAPPTGPFTVGPRWPMFARDAAGALVDPLVWGRSGQQSCLARFDARAGASLWINCSYGGVANLGNRSAVIGDRVFVEWERNFDAIDVKTGAKLWTTRLDQRIMDLCLGPDGTLRVVLEGGDTYVPDLETGQLAPSKRTYDCQAIWDDWRREGGAPGQHFGHHPDDLPAVDGMVPRGLVAHGGRTIVLGYKKPGPHVPMAAAVDKKGKLLWKRELPPEEPGLVDTDAPSHATLDDHRLCATYSVKQGVRVGCWDPTTGVTLWDSPVAVVANAREVAELVFTDSDMILLHDAHNEHAASKALGVFDLLTGAWRYDIQ